MNLIDKIIAKKERYFFEEFVASILLDERKFLLQNDILLKYYQYCDQKKKTATFRKKSSIYQFIVKALELIVQEENVYVMHRYDMAKYNYYRLRCDGKFIEEIEASDFLNLKDHLVLSRSSNVWKSNGKLHIDFEPFYDAFPALKDTRSIGNGIRYLSRFMSSKFFQQPEEWNKKLFEFMKLHKYNGTQLLINGNLIETVEVFKKKVVDLQDKLKKMKPETPYSTVESRMKRMGFEVGWGNTTGRVIETVQMVMDLFNEPTDMHLRTFLERVPMPLISRIAIISPHGWFGQENVLGRPDTGGQVIYILDQVKALEKHLIKTIELTGLKVKPKILVLTRLIPEAGDTTCNQKREQIYHTDNSWIVRIPFRDKHYNVVPQWISRFHIWPYLEQFAEDAIVEIKSEFGFAPDLIVGNYSDGNLVATLISDKLDVIQCTIAHALEKTKYLFSDLYWQDMEEDYHFSLQFIADILAMNKSNFIISSTRQEIVGTEFTMGQYESYQSFTMPGLCQVEKGIDLFAPKFNVIPPGVNEEIHFPYTDKKKRVPARIRRLKKRLFKENDKDIYGYLKDPEKFPIFTMARFDRIKNITGLIEAFGISKKLRKRCNLIFSAGSIRLEDSKDKEEQKEIRKAYELIEKYKLEGSIRWLPSIIRSDTGETLRVIADHKGIFVQPALFEAFGLTVIEAMACGLPTFGPKFGGPSEIIEYGKNGYLLNTSSPQLIAKSLEDFFQEAEKDKQLWETISANGIERVEQNYTWSKYSERLLDLSRLYSFWRFAASKKEMEKMDRYRELIFHFLFRERTAF